MVSADTQVFLKYAETFRTEVDDALTRYTDYAEGCPARLRDAIRHSLLAPGKRLRPLLVLMAAEACGSEPNAGMPAACAVEMIHTYSLMHDDLPAMADDDLRRGRPTCHKAFDEATAILAGDALLTQAFETIAGGIRPADVALQCIAELSTAAGATKLVGGQVDDLNAQDSDGGIDHLQAIHHRKTGAMFVISLRLGGIVACVDATRLQALTTFGEKLGLAFQIVDDLLDVHGQEGQLGKKTGKDSTLGKLTFPGLLGVEESRRRAETLIQEACEAMACFGERAAPLISLARYVLERTQ